MTSNGLFETGCSGTEKPLPKQNETHILAGGFAILPQYASEKEEKVCTRKRWKD